MGDTFLSHSPGHSWFHTSLSSAVPVISSPAEQSQPMRCFFILKTFHSFDHPCWSPVNISGPALFFLGTVSSPACRGTHHQCTQQHRDENSCLFFFSVSFLVVPDAQFCFLSGDRPWIKHYPCWLQCLSWEEVTNVRSIIVQTLLGCGFCPVRVSLHLLSRNFYLLFHLLLMLDHSHW